ncbi:hypothetical protein [Streptomyces sp. NK08203]|uniref:hypothetical protein n=1 Tax=Streptomyces sp. NK08203 TaxID=2821730 RepID=UPI001C2DDE25|nr:hypothetical protein [Streptomyces sp. NK08203]
MSDDLVLERKAAHAPRPARDSSDARSHARRPHRCIHRSRRQPPPRDVFESDGELPAEGSLGLLGEDLKPEAANLYVEQDLLLLGHIIDKRPRPAPAPPEDDGKGPVPPVTETTEDCAGGDRKTYARWKSCIDSSSGPHGSFSLRCWNGQFIGYSNMNCTVAGDFEIRDPRGKLVSKNNSQGRTDYDRAYVTTFTDEFRFNCNNKPRGRYSFTIKNTQVTLDIAGFPDHGYPPARVPDTTVANTMC